MIEIKTKDIREHVYRVLQKNSDDELTKEDVLKIQSLNLNQKDYKGRLNDYDFHDLIYFQNLNRCTLNGFMINEEMIDVLNRMPNIKKLAFNHCKFVSDEKITLPIDSLILNWTSINRMNNFKGNQKINNMKIIHALETIDAQDFSSFEGLKKLDVCDSTIKNVNVFDNLKGLQSLCLDGSKLDSKYQRNDIHFSHEDEFFLVG